MFRLLTSMKTKKKRISACALLFVLGFLFGSEPSFAQLSQEDKLDSLRAKFIQDSSHIFRPREVKPLIAIDGRNSFIRNNPIDVQGVQLGFSAGNYDFGMGFYKALQGYQSSTTGDIKHRIVDSTSVGFFTLFMEYTFVNTKRWEIGVLMEGGGGGFTHVRSEYQDTILKSHLINKNTFIHIGAGLDVTFNVFYWLGLNVMGGYRVALTGDHNFNFNGLFYSYGPKFYLGELVKRFKLHEKRGKYGHDISMIKDPPPWD